MQDLFVVQPFDSKTDSHALVSVINKMYKTWLVPKKENRAEMRGGHYFHLLQFCRTLSLKQLFIFSLRTCLYPSNCNIADPVCLKFVLLIENCRLSSHHTLECKDWNRAIFEWETFEELVPVAGCYCIYGSSWQASIYLTSKLFWTPLQPGLRQISRAAQMQWGSRRPRVQVCFQNGLTVLHIAVAKDHEVKSTYR